MIDGLTVDDLVIWDDWENGWCIGYSEDEIVDCDFKTKEEALKKLNEIKARHN